MFTTLCECTYTRYQFSSYLGIYYVFQYKLLPIIYLFSCCGNWKTIMMYGGDLKKLYICFYYSVTLSLTLNACLNDGLIHSLYNWKLEIMVLR